MSRFEAFLGRRYLMRVHRRPRVMYIGLIVLVIGAACMLGSTMLNQHTSTIAQSWGGAGDSWLGEDVFEVGYALGRIAQITQVIGLTLTVIGVCLSLFGFLNWWMTTFSAFSTFMIATGVAEVILVLGVMNGFQGYLRSKLIDAHAHISIEPPKGELWLSNYQEVMSSTREVEGVLGVSPMIIAEVMLRSPEQDVSAAARVLGVDSKLINETIHLDEFIKAGCGCLSVLDHPEEVDKYLSQATFPTARDFCDRPCTQSPPSNLSTTPLPSTSSKDKKRGEETISTNDNIMAIPPPSIKRAKPSILLGVNLRYSLGLMPGQQLEVISPLGDIGPNGPMPKLRPFRLGGWMSAGLVDVDSHQAYAKLSDVQHFLGVGDVISELRVRVKDIESARQIRDRLKVHLGSIAQVRDWRERNKGLFSALQLERIAMFLVLTINILLAAFSITSTLIMTLIERRREVAILIAMGAKRRSIIQIFVNQGLTAGIVGSFLGCFIGGGVCFLLAVLGLPLNAEEIYYITSIPVEVKFWDVVAIVSVALTVSLLSTLYPAYYASKIKPVEGLKGR